MNTLRFLFIITLACCTSIIYAQNGNLHFSLQQLPDMSWGIFVQPDNSINPSSRTAAGSGQVTIVAPVDFTYANLENVGGSWIENARVDAPQEAKGKTYISFGFVTDNPQINLIPNEETLLFTFTTSGAFNGSIALFENTNDPFAVPNSVGSNPGNDLGMLDFGTGNGMLTYSYAGNYGVENNQPQIILVSNEDED